MARPRSRLTWVTVLTKLSGEFELLNKPSCRRLRGSRYILERPDQLLQRDADCLHLCGPARHFGREEFLKVGWRLAVGSNWIDASLAQPFDRRWTSERAAACVRKPLYDCLGRVLREKETSPEIRVRPRRPPVPWTLPEFGNSAERSAVKRLIALAWPLSTGPIAVPPSAQMKSSCPPNKS